MAVGAFIAGEIGFADITGLAAHALEQELPVPTSVEDVFTIDEMVRKQTREAIVMMK